MGHTNWLDYMKNFIDNNLKSVSSEVSCPAKHPMCNLITLPVMFAIFSLMAFTPAVSQANTIFYTDPTTFDSSVTNLASVDFSGLTAGVRANNFSLAGVAFSTSQPFSSSSALLVFDNMIGNNWFGDTLNLSFSSGVNAVGADIVSRLGEVGVSPISAPITVTVYSGSSIIEQKTITEASGFFGVSSSSSISKVTFFSDCQSDCSTFISNLAIAQLVPVPGPDSFVLMLIGMGLLAPIARYRKG